MASAVDPVVRLLCGRGTKRPEAERHSARVTTSTSD
jgi:hypothetical protein